MPSTDATIERAPFGQLPDGRVVELITLSSDSVSVGVLTLGATLHSIKAPDGRGRSEEITLGRAELAGYLDQRDYLGVVVGRYANRIAGGRFELDGTLHRLTVNEPPNTLHGGQEGFDRRLWVATATDERVELELVSADGDQGFPGELTARVAFQLAGSELRIDYVATTTAPTVVNLTHHVYWNLSGEPTRSIGEHVLWLNARHFTPVDETMIPTGDIAPVENTPFDFFTRPAAIGERIDDDHAQLRLGLGYDHNFVLDDGASARVEHSASGRVLEVETTAPGVQFYSGNRLDGHPYPPRSGFALETQLFPDSPNQPAFPSSVIRPPQAFRSTTIYRFQTRT